VYLLFDVVSVFKMTPNLAVIEEGFCEIKNKSKLRSFLEV
jgi:ammonia channel protein AmtB